jgi:hypothetical protein
MAELEIQIRKPMFDISWIAKDILLVDGVLLRLGFRQLFHLEIQAE